MIEGSTLVKPPQDRHGKGLSMVHHSSGKPWGFGCDGVYVKTQYNYNCRPASRLWRSTPTFACELDALLACEELGLNTPRVLSYRDEDGVTELVLQDISNALTMPYYWAQSCNGRVERVLEKLGRMVGKLHRAGWVHGSIAGGHVLIQPQENDRVWLIDFEKAKHAFSERQMKRDLMRFLRRSPYLRPLEVDCLITGYRSVRNTRYLDEMAERFAAERAARLRSSPLLKI